jgi:hypothetical protein
VGSQRIEAPSGQNFFVVDTATNKRRERQVGTFEQPLRLRRMPVAFVPPDIVTRRRAVTPPIVSEPNPSFDGKRHDQISYRPMEKYSKPVPETDTINIKEVTDRVVEALDRRTMASHERMSRR